MLSNFIRRNGKRKASRVKINEQTSSSSEASPRVVNIGDRFVDLDESPSTISITNNVRSPLVQLNLPSDSEEWFPQELLQRRASSQISAVASHGTAPATPDNPTIEISQHSQSSSSSGRTTPAEDGRLGLHARKKSIPAPIIIPDVTCLVPNVQIGHSAPPSSAALTKSVPQNDETASSENLSAVSGTTLARALIANSFVLSSIEHRKSRHRSGMARQDSATLPRGESLSNFSPRNRDKWAESMGSSDSTKPMSIPPVPPLPIGPFLHPKHTPGLMSGSSTCSEYPISDAYITSPEGSSHAGRRISRIQELPSPAPSTPSMSATQPPQQSMSSTASDSPRTHQSNSSDVPSTASDLSSPLDSRQGPMESSQAESFTLNSSDHTLDEFDFVPLGPRSTVISPASDSSASYTAPPQNVSRRLRGGRDGQLNVMTSTPKDNADTDRTLVSPRGDVIPSAVSDQGYGELLDYPLTMNPEMTPPWSMTTSSAGYQTFPETPALFTPLVSAGFGVFGSDSQWSRTLKSAPGRQPGKLSQYGTLLNRHEAKRQRAKTAAAVVLPLRKTPPPPRPERPSTSPSPQPSQKEAEEPPPSTADTTLIEQPEEPQEPEKTGEAEESEKVNETKLIPHPLAHISSSSSKLQADEALQAFARHSRSSLPSMSMYAENASPSSPVSPYLVPLPESGKASRVSLPVAESVVSSSSSASMSVETIPQPQLRSLPVAAGGPSIVGSSFLPSPSSSPTSLASLKDSRTTSPAPHVPPSRASSFNSISPSYVAPPPYHTVVSERTPHHPLSASSESGSPLSSALSADVADERTRKPSTSTLPEISSRTRLRSRPRLPGGPRKPSGLTQQPLGSLVPGPIKQKGSTTSVGTREGNSPVRSPWTKLYAAASKPPPKFHTPPPKWRGLTLEAAQWTFTSEELQTIVSRAIQGSSEGSSIRLLRLETLEGEIADEVHRLEMQHTDVKARYKALVRKRWTLMGALAGHIEGVEMNDTVTAIQTMEELAEVSLELDHLTEKLHDIVEQLSQLKSLREVHNRSALAMALRKIHHSFFRQMAEKERLVEQIDNLQTERDEAWNHAEKVAKDCDELNDRLLETTASGGNSEAQSPINDDAISFQSNRRSTRLCALRKSSIRQSQAGLRSKSKPRSRRSSFSAPAGPSAPSAEVVPPVPSLPLNSNPTDPRFSPMLSAALSTGVPLHTGALSTGSIYSSASTEIWALSQVQRDVYEMLGMSLPASAASSRPRTISGPNNLWHGSRPLSDSGTGTGYPTGLKPRANGRRATMEGNRAIKNVIIDDR